MVHLVDFVDFVNRWPVTMLNVLNLAAKVLGEDVEIDKYILTTHLDNK
jgi:hypothetical protein